MTHTHKTNRSLAKRITITGTGRVFKRRPGQNHFNAKERTSTSNGKHRSVIVHMDNKAKSRFLATSF